MIRNPQTCKIKHYKQGLSLGHILDLPLKEALKWTKTEV